MVLTVRYTKAPGSPASPIQKREPVMPSRVFSAVLSTAPEHIWDALMSAVLALYYAGKPAGRPAIAAHHAVVYGHGVSLHAPH